MPPLVGCEPQSWNGINGMYAHNQVSAIPSTASHTQSASANGVEQEYHLLFECSHVALVASRSKHMALFDGVRDVREWM
jgi:hypothetical protein